MDSGTRGGYRLGHSGTEIGRLVLQARLYDPLSIQALSLAGLKPGMRVLDVGCGAGDLTFAAASLVGPTGTVIGVDAAPEALITARDRAARAGLSGVCFHRADLTAPDFGRDLDFDLGEPVDAVVGRLVLTHLPDPAGTLWRVARLVRPGGIVCFQEFESSKLRSVPAAPLATDVLAFIMEALTAGGADLTIGSSLYALFTRGGLPPPRLSASTPLGGRADGAVFPLVAATCRALLALGLVTGAGADKAGDGESLLERLTAEADAANSIIVMPTLVSAWSTLPPGPGPGPG